MRISPLIGVLVGCAALGGSCARAADVAPTLFVGPAGSDAGSCTRAQPCASFDRAFRVAKPGQTVELAGGTYPPQTVNVDPSKVAAAADVVFQPAPGAVPTIAGDLVMKGSHAVFKGPLKLRFLFSEAVAGASTSNAVRFENLDGAAFLVGPNRDITIKGGDWGPNTGPGTQENKIGPDGGIAGQYPTNITLDGLLIHDQNSNDLSVEHMGGLFLISGNRITIRNTRFVRNVVYNIQVQDFTNPDCCGMTFGPMRDVLLEGNVFEHPVTSLGEGAGDDRQPDVQLDPRHGACWVNWTIRRNSFQNGLALGFDGQPCFQNVSVSGNIGPALGFQCWPGAGGLAWSDNIWTGAPCSAADKGAPFGYTLDGLALRPAGVAAAGIRRAFRLAAAGTPTAKIAAALRRDLGSTWTVARLKELLADRTYLGGRYGGVGAQPALVDPVTWRKSRKSLAG